MLVAILLTLRLGPQPAQAQKEEPGLTLSLRDVQYNYNIEAIAGQDNRFFLEVRNTGANPITNLRLSAQQPGGWTIEIKPAEISYLSSGSLETIDVNIKPDGRATQEIYSALFIAQANEIRKEQPFWVRVKGELELTLSLRRDQQDYYNFEAKAGQDNKFFLEVRNIGTQPITDIRLTAEEPEGWVIEIKPAAIGYLGFGSLETIDVNINPVGKAIKQNYSVTFIAESNEIGKRQTFSVTVNPAQFWIWIWVLAGVVVVAGFVLIYWRFGRQQSSP